MSSSKYVNELCILHYSKATTLEIHSTEQVTFISLAKFSALY